MIKTDKEGILVGGAYSGLKDISESVIQASAAALSASRVIHSAGGGLAPETLPIPSEQANPDRQLPRTLVAICTCDDTLTGYFNDSHLISRLSRDPAVCGVETLPRTCTASGWEALTLLIDRHQPNRLLIGACMPYVYARKIKGLSAKQGLNPACVEVVDIRTPLFVKSDPKQADDSGRIMAAMESALLTGLAKLKRVNPVPVPTIQVYQRALVVGGGIAGMSAALAIAEHGFSVDLIEQSPALGGNLTWLQNTLEGHAVKPFLDQTIERIEKHPLVKVRTRSRVAGAYGQVGRFHTSIESEDGQVDALAHGAVILATGGRETATTSYGSGQRNTIMTQMALEQELARQRIDPTALEAVVMIQCVDSREEPRNYCSRVCCSSALKHAQYLKDKNPDIAIYILYRDMMSYGFMETYFTQARQAGIIFIQYDVKAKPEVILPEGSNGVQVKVFDAILGRPVEIEADLLVLSTGITPALPADLAELFGASVDPDGFFQEAETKWRPVDSLKRVFSLAGWRIPPARLPKQSQRPKPPRSERFESCRRSRYRPAESWQTFATASAVYANAASMPAPMARASSTATWRKS